MVILGDDAFPLKTYLLKPYPFRQLENDKIHYNKRLSRCRRVIENTFGIMCRKFQIFYRPLNLRPIAKYTDVVLACVVLHNYLRSTNDVKAGEDLQCPLDGLFDSSDTFRGRPTKQAKVVQNEFKEWLYQNQI